MSQRARFQQADVTRLLKAAKSAGYENARVIVRTNGEIELIVGEAGASIARDNEWADLE